jgi:DUF4097 and DUF4098 domain-containing protein YvlB
MPTFETRQPISVIVELGVGGVSISASDRADSVVTVRPSDPDEPGDVLAAERTTVEYDDGELRIRAPKTRKAHVLRGDGDAVEVHVELPAGSKVRMEAAVASLHATGRLEECRYKTGAGDIHIDEARLVSLKTAAGDIGVRRAGGPCEISTSSGAVRITSVHGPTAIKNANGDTEIGEMTGILKVKSANGTVAVDRVSGTLAARTARGDIRVGEVASGTVVAETSFGRIDVGIRGGVAAWLDLHTAMGRVDSTLDASERPGPEEEQVEVKAHTAFGDISVRRAG